MRHVNGVYTQRFNRYHGEDGQLFRGRYKAVLVDEDSYLLEVLRYIHRNPLRAGVAAKLDDFSWSSHRAYISGAKKWQWLYRDFLLGMLSTKKGKRRLAYLDFVSQDDAEEMEQFYSAKKLSSVLGGDSFKEWVKEHFGHLRLHKEIPEARTLAPSPEKIIDLVCTHFKIKKKQLMISKRGRENLPRDVAIYLVRRYSGGTLTDVGSYFGIENYSTVSSAVQRIKARGTDGAFLHETLSTLEKGLKKGQQQT
jgi:hypothetical protein